MAILFVVVILKDRSRIFEQTEGQGIVMFALVAAMVCASCFMSEIVYVCSPMSFMFWMALSVMMRLPNRKKKHNRRRRVFMQRVLSVSVAAYNVQQFIEQCLDSFLDPAVTDRVEVLVTDDGSKDDTAKIVAEYEAKYPGAIR